LSLYEAWNLYGFLIVFYIAWRSFMVEIRANKDLNRINIIINTDFSGNFSSPGFIYLVEK